MQGAKIDPKQEPEKAAQRDEYRGQFLEGIKNAGEARLLAAQTFDNPGGDAKEILQKSLETFTELSDKYEGYVQGAIALAFRGEVQTELGMKEPALDSFIRMLEQQDVDALREAKFRAVAGIIRIHMSESPPKYQNAIDAGAELAKDFRPNEKALPIVQSLRLALAKAYLAKSADKENQDPASLRRAQSAGQQLLVDASKIPGTQAGEANTLLSEMGIEIAKETEELPTTEDPTSFQDALDKSRQLLQQSEELRQTLVMLNQQGGKDPSVEQQKITIEQQMQQSRGDAIRIMRFGLGMVTPSTDPGSVNQARQLLAYVLYQNKDYRSASAVGRFLSRTAAGTDIGLQGGLLALNSLQLLLSEDSENAGLTQQLQDLGDYLTRIWPDDPKATAAQGIMLKLALKSGQFDKATELIAKLPDGTEKQSSLRLMGRILWNDSFRYRKEGQDAESKQAVVAAENALATGLSGMGKESIAPDVMQSALTLTKIYLDLDDAAKADATLRDETYGPLTLIDRQGSPDKSYESDLYSTELMVVVQLMTAPEGDPKQLVERAAKVIEKLQSSVQGPDAQKRLTSIYVRMAKIIREQLDRADVGRRTKLIDAFQLFLAHISSTTTNPETLQWTATTLIELAESSIGPNGGKASGQAAALLTTAVTTLERLKTEAKEPSLTIDFQLGRAQRILGDYKSSIDTLEGLLKEKPTMLDAQIEAALAYEQWAAVVPPEYAGKAYQSALNGARPNAKQENTIWGWGTISLRTMRDPKYKAAFFDSRYHVALCRFLWGKAANDQRVIKKSESDITQVHTLHPDLGGPEQYNRFDQLLKTIQKELGAKATGLPKAGQPVPK